MSISDSLHNFVDKVALKNDEVYAKIGIVTKIDDSKSTCTVKPIDGSPEIFDVRLKASLCKSPNDIKISKTENTASSDHPVSLIEVPQLGSHVCVIFLNANNAFVALSEKVDTIYQAIAPIPSLTGASKSSTYSLMNEGFYGLNIDKGESVFKVGDSIIKITHKNTPSPVIEIINKQADGSNSITLDTNGISIEDKNANKVTTNANGIIIEESNSSKITLSSSGTEITDGTNTITLGSDGVNINGNLSIKNDESF